MSEAHLPTRLLERFTDREDEQQRFREILATQAPQPLPTLNFHGVGGVGKTWLRRRLEDIRRQEFPQISSALIDYDTRTRFGTRYSTDPADAWLEIAKTLNIPCPRFLLAYAVLRAKQTAAPIEAKSLSHGEASKLDVAGQLAGELLGSDMVKAALSGVPLVGLAPFLARKGVEQLKKRQLEESPDYQALMVMAADQIYDDLLSRLIADLNDDAPQGATNQCHSVVFFDTFEALGDLTHASRQSEREEWVRKFARGTTRTLVVVLGQNRVTWDEKPGGAFWKQREHLETRPVGSLSEQDARLYLRRCEITDRALQDEVLRDSSCAPDPGYHPWTLGLCGDTLWTMREERGDGTFPPAKEFLFEAGEHGPAKVVERFLRTLPDARRRWIERLAVTLRFDEAAALIACRAGEDESRAAWERLREFSFLSPGATGGWSVLHSHMRNQMLAILSDARRREEHTFWRDHWQGLSEAATDQYAGLAWYHRWHLDPEMARSEWDTLAEGLRRKIAMREHWEILGWPSPLRSEPDSGDKELRSSMLVSYGVELVEASLGNRAQNLRAAIACYDLALDVYTRAAYPQQWAMTQNNKGNALQSLPDGNRAQNLRAAIACFDLSLEVRTREAFPQQWAGTQNNKGNALSDLPDGDRSQNLRAAIACFDLSLEVRTREAFPQDWAMTQNNKGNALQSLPDGNRAQNLHEAIACYDLALDVYTRAAYPQQWAMTQNNKGAALQSLPDGNRAQNLRAAIACFDLSLDVYTRAAYPQQWAATQNNKGNALAELTDGDRSQNLRAAIACFDLALEVRTREAYPQQWAMTQNNKGTALQSLPGGDRTQNLHAAIACFDLALEVQTREAYPQQWAMTHFNRCLMFAGLEDWDGALQEVEMAVAGYRQAGHSFNLQEAEKLKQDILNAMSADDEPPAA